VVSRDERFTPNHESFNSAEDINQGDNISRFFDSGKLVRAVTPGAKTHCLEEADIIPTTTSIIQVRVVVLEYPPINSSSHR
jgi:hypothetical protein